VITDCVPQAEACTIRKLHQLIIGGVLREKGFPGAQLKENNADGPAMCAEHQCG
jgi:hypothetical protein